MSEENIFPICNRCQKPIQDPALVYIQPAILLQKFFVQVPPLFSCPEHAQNFARVIIFHDDCWMEELKDHGVDIYDMKEVKKKYAKEALEKITNESGSSLSSESKEV